MSEIWKKALDNPLKFLHFSGEILEHSKEVIIFATDQGEIVELRLGKVKVNVVPLDWVVIRMTPHAYLNRPYETNVPILEGVLTLKKFAWAQDWDERFVSSMIVGFEPAYLTWYVKGNSPATTVTRLYQDDLTNKEKYHYQQTLINRRRQEKQKRIDELGLQDWMDAEDG